MATTFKWKCVKDNFKGLFSQTLMCQRTKMSILRGMIFHRTVVSVTIVTCKSSDLIGSINHFPVVKRWIKLVFPTPSSPINSKERRLKIFKWVMSFWDGMSEEVSNKHSCLFHLFYRISFDSWLYNLVRHILAIPFHEKMSRNRSCTPELILVKASAKE